MSKSQKIEIPKNLLVIECQGGLNWFDFFKDAALADGTPIKVDQAEWDDISVVSYYDSGIIFTSFY